jgi:hypothetical protein
LLPALCTALERLLADGGQTFALRPDELPRLP